MTTYTYDPLVGMTSQCDVANRITYYEYDEMGRLKDVKDQDGNVIKTYDYHYHTN
jgi:YD repeat-containing protein